MARRRRNPFAGVPNRNQGIPTPIQAVTPVIDLPGLRTAYAWMTLNKLAGFKLVLEWYANNQTALLYKDPLDAAKQKEYETVGKLERQGHGTTLEPEKITAWSMAIRKMERLWSHKLPDWPTLDKAASVQVPELITNVQTVLNNLNAAFTPAGVTFRITFDAARQFLHGEILIPQTEAVAMITQTPLQVALTEAPTVAKVLSIVHDANGQHLDGGLFMKKLPEVLEYVGKWTAGADKINKPVGKAPQAKAARVGAKRAAGAAGPALKLNPTDIITLTGAANNAFKAGKRGTVWNLIRNGMTVAQLRSAAQAQINAGGYALQVLKVMVSKGLVKIN